ncbi:hypothetical protein TRAPUB_4215 [Trametes pubescens]|uniref:Uncharacterized protein n=1 Tax=Trametes pubescens TaxID=154538 RepID=A0A1M2VBN0_TRAPU|nr:hypothetical protein TRAPUB_4215 [Trametes pubescens]
MCKLLTADSLLWLMATGCKLRISFAMATKIHGFQINARFRVSISAYAIDATVLLVALT